MFRFRNCLRFFSALIFPLLVLISCSENNDFDKSYGKYTITYYDRESTAHNGFLYSLRVDGGDIIELPDLNDPEYRRLLRGRAGYDFIGWRDKVGRNYFLPANYKVIESEEFDAVWDQNVFTVTLYNEDNTTVYDIKTVQRGEVFKLPPLTNTASEIFLGWKRDSLDAPPAKDNVTVNKDTAFYQSWADRLSTFPVKFYGHYSGGSPNYPLAPSSSYLTNHPTYTPIDAWTLGIPVIDPLIFPKTTDFTSSFVTTNYDFDGWYLFNVGERYNPGTDYEVTGNLSVVARWTPSDPTNPPPKVKANLYDEGELVQVMEEYPVNAFWLPDIKRDGYKFKLWHTGSPIGVTAENPVFLTQNTDFYAEFELDNPVLIGSAAELNGIRDDLDGVYQLTGDINTAPSNWLPIGTGASPFTGILDGNGKSVTICVNYNQLSADAQEFVGLFGVLDKGARIDNLTVIVNSCGITGKSYAGGVAGLVKGTADNVTKIVKTRVNGIGTGRVYANNPGLQAYAGGIAGVLGNYTVTDNTSNALQIDAEGESAYAGGITALNNGALITGSSNSGIISATGVIEAYAGGIAGVHSKDNLTLVHNTGAVSAVVNSDTGSAYAGGIFGQGDKSEDCSNSGIISALGSGLFNFKGKAYAGGVSGSSMGISRCYNIGDVSAAGGSLTHVGGLSGLAENSVNNSYNKGAVSAADAENAYAGGIVGYHTTGEIINTYNIGEVKAASNGTVYAAGILGFMKTNIWLTLNAAANIKVDGTASSAANRHVNRVLGGNIGFTPSDVVENFALDVMDGTFTNSGIYQGNDRTGGVLQTEATYSDPIGSYGLEFEFCDGTQTRPCGTLYPWRWPTTVTYQYPILYWQDVANPF